MRSPEQRVAIVSAARSMARLAVAAAVMVAALWPLSRLEVPASLSHGPGGVLRLALLVAAGGLAYAGALRLVSPSEFGYFSQQALRLVRRPRAAGAAS
jgi:hypothetical protein